MSGGLSKQQKIKWNEAIEAFKQRYPETKRSVLPRQLEVFYGQQHQLKVEEIEFEVFINWLKEAEALGVLQPLKSHKTSKTRSGVEYYNQYKWKLFELESDHDIGSCFASFHPLLQEGLTYYLKNPLDFDADMTYLEQLSERLFSIEATLKTPYTINQRSFQLFQNEKLISGKGLKATSDEGRWQTVLKRTKLTGLPTSLNYLELKQFPQTIELNRKESAGVVLILENQDPMLTLVQLLRSEVIHPCPFDGLVLGSGNTVESIFYYLYHDTFKSVLSHPQTTYYYAGDLDMEGLKIFNRLKTRYADREIHYLPGYFKFLLEQTDESTWRQTTQQKPSADDLAWLSNVLEEQSLSTEQLDLILTQLQHKKMLPQEVMTQADWKHFLNHQSVL